jgi:hypothetical protein
MAIHPSVVLYPRTETNSDKYIAALLVFSSISWVMASTTSTEALQEAMVLIFL